VPDVGTSSNVNLDDEPILGSESSSSEDEPSDGSNLLYDSDDDEDVSKYVRVPRKWTPGQRYHTKQSAWHVRPSFSSSDSLGLNSDPLQRSPDPIWRSPDPVQRLPDLVQRSPVMERRTSDQDNVTGRIVDESAAPEKTDAIGRSVHDATGPSRPPITHVYTSAGRGKKEVLEH
jgi:hypothetical protein